MLQLATDRRALLKLLHPAAGAYSRLSFVARYAMLDTPVVQVTSLKGARQLTNIEFIKVTKHNLNAARQVASLEGELASAAGELQRQLEAPHGMAVCGAAADADGSAQCGASAASAASWAVAADSEDAVVRMDESLKAEQQVSLVLSNAIMSHCSAA